jgi:hypothetical protein
MVVAEVLTADRQALTVERLCLGIVALPAEGVREVVLGVGYERVVGAEPVCANAKSPAERGVRSVVVPFVTE